MQAPKMRFLFGVVIFCIFVSRFSAQRYVQKWEIFSRIFWRKYSLRFLSLCSLSNHGWALLLFFVLGLIFPALRRPACVAHGMNRFTKPSYWASMCPSVNVAHLMHNVGDVECRI